MNSVSAGAQTGQGTQTDLQQLKALIELQRQQIEIQQRAVEGQQKQIETQQGLIQAQQERLDSLEAATASLKTITLDLYETRPQSVDDLIRPAALLFGPGSEGYRYGNGYHSGYVQAPADGRQGQGAERVAQAEEAAPVERAEPEARPEILTGIAERGGILTPKGTVVIEPSVEYLHDSSDRVVIEGFAVLPAILIGSIDVRRVDRDSIFGSIGVRYGVTDRFEVDAKVPYLYREDSTLAREIAVESTAATVSNVTGHGIGDVEFGAHYQINHGTGGWPFLIGNLRVKAPTGEDPFEVDVDETGLQTELPTGSGFWGLEPSMTFLLPSDPVVWWGNVKYLWNVERDIGGGFGTINPGDAAGVTLGMGFGVNPDFSFSLGWEHQFVFESEQDGRTIEGTDLQLGSFLLGMSYRLSEAVRLNLTFQGGVTDDATDSRMLLRVPIRLNLL